jgi:hypothetical protein
MKQKISNRNPEKLVFKIVFRWWITSAIDKFRLPQFHRWINYNLSHMDSKRDILGCREQNSDSKLSMGNLPQKMCLFFLGLFYSYGKKKQLCRRFFLIRALFRRENSIWKFKPTGTTGTLWEETTKTSSVVVKNWGFQIEFSRRKWARIEKNSSTKLFLLSKRIK